MRGDGPSGAEQNPAQRLRRVAGVLGGLANPPPDADKPPVRLLNIGNNRSEQVTHLIELLEDGLGRKAIIEYTPRPAAAVPDTWASVDAIAAISGYAPTTRLEVGIPKFVAWFQQWRTMRDRLPAGAA